MLQPRYLPILPLSLFGELTFLQVGTVFFSFGFWSVFTFSLSASRNPRLRLLFSFFNYLSFLCDKVSPRVFLNLPARSPKGGRKRRKSGCCGRGEPTLSPRENFSVAVSDQSRSFRLPAAVLLCVCFVCMPSSLTSPSETTRPKITLRQNRETRFGA